VCLGCSAVLLSLVILQVRRTSEVVRTDSVDGSAHR